MPKKFPYEVYAVGHQPLGSVYSRFREVTGKKSRAEHAAEVVQRMSQAQPSKSGFMHYPQAP